MRKQKYLIRCIVNILLLIILISSIYITKAINIRYDEYEDGSIFIAQETDKMIQITAQGAILMDAKTGAILYNKNVNKNYYPASITKIMTALVVIENVGMDEIVTYSDNAINNLDPDSSVAGINVGAKLTVKDSLYALLTVSGNEAAAGLAEYVAGTQDKFAKMMTKKAKEIGCLHTTFKNPHGLYHEEHKTTAYDIALILKYAMQYEDFREVMKAETYNIYKSDTLIDDLELWNHSDLMRRNSSRFYMFTEGSKTGYISEAGNTLASYAKKGDMELICVVLKDKGSAIYDDTKKLFEYGFDNFEMKNALEDYNLIDDIRTNVLLPSKTINAIQNLELEYNNQYMVMDRKNTKYDCQFYFDDDISNGKLGYIKIMANNKEITNIDVTYNPQSYKAEDYITRYKAINTKQLLPKINEIKENNIEDLHFFEIIVIVALAIILVRVAFLIKDTLIILTMKDTAKGRRRR